MKLSKITVIFFFTLMQLIVAYGLQQQEVIQLSITELRDNPSKYEGKIVRIIGWMDTDCRRVSRWVNSDAENARNILVMHPNSIKSDMLVQKNELFKEFWGTCPGWDNFNPCKKDIEVEIEGIVEENREIRKELYPDGTTLLGSIRVKIPEEFFEENKELPKEWYPDGMIVLRVTRVIRIEEKYRTPPMGICVEETPEEIYENYRIVPKFEIDIPKPELNLEIMPLDVNQYPVPPPRAGDEPQAAGTGASSFFRPVPRLPL